MAASEAPMEAPMEAPIEFPMEEPSYLGASPRHPLPTTSIDHADLVSPMKQLDLSASEDEEDVDRVKIALTDASSIASESRSLVDATDDLEATSKEKLLADEDSSKAGNSPSLSATTDSAGAAPASGSKPSGNKRSKPAGRVVASRYMAETQATRRDQSRPQGKPSAPQAKAPTRLKASSPQASTPPTKPSTPQAKPSTPQAKPSASQAKPSTPQAKPSTPQAKPSTPQRPNASQRTTPQRPAAQRTTPQTSKTKTTPKMQTPSDAARLRNPGPDTAGAGETTPKSSTAAQKHEEGEISRKDLEMMNWMMARTRLMAAANIKSLREAYLKQATQFLVASSTAIGRLCGKHNENLSLLFTAQCESKAIALDAACKDVLLEQSKLENTKVALAQLEQALLSKGRNLEASGSILLPMSDDETGQAALLKKLVQKLKTQMIAFRAIDEALPRGVRDTTRALALLLGELDEAATLSADRIEACSRHLRACLDLLVDAIYVSRTSKTSRDHGV